MGRFLFSGVYLGFLFCYGDSVDVRVVRSGVVGVLRFTSMRWRLSDALRTLRHPVKSWGLSRMGLRWRAVGSFGSYAIYRDAIATFTQCKVLRAPYKARR